MADETITTLVPLAGGGVQVETVDHAAVRARVLKLKEQVEQDGWDLSVALWEVYEGALYQAWAFADWKSYVEAELEFKLRKAQYMVAVQDWVRYFAPDFVEWVRTLGLGKARLLSSRVTPENAATWRPRLEGKTYREIEALLAGEDPDAGEDGGEGGEGGGGDGDGGAPERADVLRFALFPAQRRNVDLAVERAKVLGETDKDGVALDYICTAFNATEGHYKRIDEHLAALERSLGMRIVAFKQLPDATYKVNYGKEFMNEMFDAVDAEEAAQEQTEKTKGKK